MRSRLFILALSLGLAAGLTGAAAKTDPWTLWRDDLARRCPANHVDWIGDGDYDDLLGAFARTLPARTNRRVEAIVDYPHRCAHEQAGFSCAVATHLDAYQRLGLLDRFTTFGCHAVKCQEPSLCSRRPGVDPR